MSAYSKILVAIDLSEEAGNIIQKGLDIAGGDHSKVTVLHVIEPLGYAYGGDIPMDLSDVQEKIYKHAGEQLKEIGAKLNFNVNDLKIAIGKPHSEIRSYAKENKVDLIVLGTHGKQGLQLLLGSTSNSVLHKANCDILAVKVD